MESKQSENPLEVRLFRMSLYVCLMAASALLFHEVILDFNYADILFESLAILFSITFLVLMKKTNTHEYLIPAFISLIFMLLNFSWFLNKGLGIGLALDFLVLHVMAIIIISPRLIKMYLALFTINILILFGVEFFHPDFFYISMQYRIAPVTSKTVVISIAYTIVTWLVLYLKSQYNLTLQEVLKQKGEIESQNELIHIHNNSLEKLVEKRTSHIKLQNERLLQYAFFNSHKVRAPLSNILGLVYILQQNADSMERKDRETMLETLKNESERLDSEIRTIQEIIHQNADLEKLN